MHSNTIKALGVCFYNGDLEDACLIARRGGLITAPSGPGLSQDLPGCSEYRRALENSDLILPDSGLLCLWQKWFKKSELRRLSGLIFLHCILEKTDWKNESALWIMPDEKQADANVKWIQKTYGKRFSSENIYIAPLYPKKGPLKDESLIAQIEAHKPASIFNQIGGGVQERLGLFLKENLSYSPSIYCTGAALAFLSGQQVKIPKWVDTLYLGWLLRCIHRPNIFIPRYLKAFRLVYLLAKYGKNPPPIRG